MCFSKEKGGDVAASNESIFRIKDMKSIDDLGNRRFLGLCTAQNVDV